MNNIIKLVITDKQDLAKAYIPFFKNGGLFVKGKTNFNLGDEIFLIVSLEETGEQLAVNGRIGWLSPPSSVTYPSGIGIHFNQEKAGLDAKSRIEILLGSLLKNLVNRYTF